MVTIQFRFSILNDVIIMRNNIRGTVKGLFSDEDSIRYALVEYATSNGTILTKYFREDVLRTPDSDGK